MRQWTLLLGGLAVWAAHFFLLYAIASIFPGTQVARTLALVVTVPALAGDGWLLLLGWSRFNSETGYERWIARVGLLGAAFSTIAVLWQALSAVLL